MNALSVVLNGMTPRKIKQVNKLITGKWNLLDLKEVTPNGLKVMSCFHCGGGSTMGYKLAGFEVLGGVEIDPKMMEMYRKNHSPPFSFQMGVQEFNKLPREKIPDVFFDLDVLDGSPPCSSFSMAGSREKAWGENKKFTEGQAEQVLDDLFFDFIKIADILKPKVVVAENVKGLLQGKAKGYVKMIANQFDLAGYDLQLFLLNSAFMGVPQRRERTFFIARRKDLSLPKIKLDFNEEVISVEKAWSGINELGKDVSTSSMVKYWNLIKPGEAMSKVHEKGSLFGQMKLDPKLPCQTMTSKTYQFWHWEAPRLLSKLQASRLQSFPDDYDFLKNDPKYVCGMSVPPLMMQRVANQIAHQLFNKAELKL